MGNIDPLLYDLGALMRFQLLAVQNGPDDAFGDCIELGNSSSDGGSQVFIFFLISLRPDAAQTVVWHHSFKQCLEQHIKHHVKAIRPVFFISTRCIVLKYATWRSFQPFLGIRQQTQQKTTVRDINLPMQIHSLFICNPCITLCCSSSCNVNSVLLHYIKSKEYACALLGYMTHYQ